MVGTGLRGVNTSYRSRREREAKEQQVAERRRADEARVQQRINEGIWHDGRLDCVAGNGIMSELGVGDELFGDNEIVISPHATEKGDAGGEGERNGNGNGSEEEAKRKQRSLEDLKAVEAMPVVVLRNFETKGGGEQREILMGVLSQWAATLAENQVQPFPSQCGRHTEDFNVYRSRTLLLSATIARILRFWPEVCLHRLQFMSYWI